MRTRFGYGNTWAIDINQRSKVGGYQVVRIVGDEQKVIGFRPGYTRMADANRVALEEAVRLDDLERAASSLVKPG